MSNLKEFLNNELSEDKEDDFMGKITKIRMDGIKKGYQEKLKSSYGVSKDIQQPSNNKRTILKTLIAFAAAILVFFLFYKTEFLSTPTNDAEVIASYIQNNKVNNYDIIRGGNEAAAAYGQYQSGNYTAAIDAWNSGAMNLQDSFYLALSYLYTNQYDDAGNYFDALNQQIGTLDKFYSEHQLYWALTLVLQEKEDQAEKLYESWPVDSWMSQEYEKIAGLKE